MSPESTPPPTLEERLAAATTEVTSLRAELARTRASLRDPAPGVDLDPAVVETIRRVRAERLTYLTESSLTGLAGIVAEIEREQRPGLIVEAGTARGGSAIVLATAKRTQRPMKVYDVFGMIPPPSENDPSDVHARYADIAAGRSRGIGGDVYYGYRDDLYTEVRESFASLGVPVEQNSVELVRGLFADTLHLDEPVALAHLDGDWYDSTMTCLERIAPLLVPHGRIVLDDYYFWSGARDATEDYLADHPELHLELREKAQLVRVR